MVPFPSPRPPKASGTANDGVIGWLDLSTYYAAHPNPGSTVSDVNKYITKRALQVGDTLYQFRRIRHG